MQTGSPGRGHLKLHRVAHFCASVALAVSDTNYHLSVRFPSSIPFSLFFSINSLGLRPFRANHFFNSSVLTRYVFGFSTTDTTNSAAHVGSSTTECLKIAEARQTASKTVAACTSTEWRTPRRSTNDTLHF